MSFCFASSFFLPALLSLLLLVVFYTPGAAAGSAGFMASPKAAAEAQSLLQMLRAMEYGGVDLLERIEADLATAFQSVPKNTYGRIDILSTRYLLQLYFAKERGWQLKGLEPHGFLEEVSEIHEVALLQEQAPALAAVLSEATAPTTAVSSPGRNGFTLRDVAAIAATLERLVRDESLDLLEASYHANKLSPSDAISAEDMHEVLCTFLMLFELWDQVDVDHPARTGKFEELTRVHGMGLEHIVDFEQEAFYNDAFARRSRKNPFVAAQYTREDAVRIVESLVGSYGRWQNQECAYMSDQLHLFSKQGHFPLQSFSSAQMQELGFEFTESLQYLEDVGALDPATKDVRLANYITGPSNCIPASKYFSICCMSECDAITHEIMAKIQGPEASAREILGVVSNISSRYVEGPRQLSRSLVRQLEALSERHEGSVQLHSRLFAQWLHNAFPSDCPYPHIVEDQKVLKTDYWKDALSSTSTAESPEVRLERIANSTREARQVYAAHNESLESFLSDGQDILYLDSRAASRRSASKSPNNILDNLFQNFKNFPMIEEGLGRVLPATLPVFGLLLVVARYASDLYRSANRALGVVEGKEKMKKTGLGRQLPQRFDSAV